MVNKCENCTEKCPQAETAHNAALGRMYATKEFVALLKKIESGELVEVVRCKDCKHAEINDNHPNKPLICFMTRMCGTTRPNWFCADGERKDNE